MYRLTERPMLDIAENVESRVRRFDGCRSIDARLEGEDMHRHRVI